MKRHMRTHNKTPVDDPADDQVDDQVDEETIEEFIVELIEDTESGSNEAPDITAQSSDTEEFGVTRMKLFVCGQCHYTSNRSFDLRRHEQIHSKVKIIDGTAFKCTKCPFITKWKRNMNRHLKKHVDLCNEMYVEQLDDKSSEEIIVQLINSDDTRSDYEMDEVDNDYNENSEMPPSPPICYSPNSESEIQNNLLDTRETKDNEVNGQKRFKCAQCPYESKRAFDLRRHEQRHKKVKIVEGTAVKCTECSFVTKWKRNMTRHMQKHQPKSPLTEAPIFNEQSCQLAEDVNHEVQYETLSIEPLNSTNIISNFDPETMKISYLDLGKTKSKAELEILEFDEDPEVLPSYWHAIEQEEESVLGS